MSAAPASPRIAILRGFWLNNFEMQNYAPLQSAGWHLHAYATEDHLYELGLIGLPVTILKTPRRAPGTNIPGVRRYVGRWLRGRGQHDYWAQDMHRVAAENDILHAAETSNGFSLQAARAARDAGKPLVLTVWENIPFLRQGTPQEQVLASEVRASTALFLAITPRAAAALRVEGVPEEKVRVIGCGVDLAHFCPQPPDGEWCRRLGLEETDFVVLCAAQLLASKGLFELLSALALLRPELPSLLGKQRRLKVLLVGKGPEEAALRQRRDQLGLTDIVDLPGQVSYADMPRVHNLADLFVLPSIPTPTWQEQFGMVLAESMACGKPVLTTLSGSIPDVVGNAALSVQPADPLALAAGLRLLLADPHLRREKAEQGLQRAREEFDARHVADRIAACYRELLPVPGGLEMAD